MNPEQNLEEKEVQQPEQKLNSLNSVTPLSKYLAMILFIIMPFIGGWIGYTYAPEKIVEVEKQVAYESVAQEKETKIYQNDSAQISELDASIKENDSISINTTTTDSSSDEKLFRAWDQYRDSKTLLLNGDPIATIERDFPSSNSIVYQANTKLKTFFTLDDSHYYYSPCQPLYYLDTNKQRYYNFEKDYCPTDGWGIGVKNALVALPVIFQYGKMENELNVLSLETELEVPIFSINSLTPNESLISRCVEGNYELQKIPDLEVIGKSLRVGIYEKSTDEGSCIKEESYKKLRDVVVTY